MLTFFVTQLFESFESARSEILGLCFDTLAPERTSSSSNNNGGVPTNAPLTRFVVSSTHTLLSASAREVCCGVIEHIVRTIDSSALNDMQSW